MNIQATLPNFSLATPSLTLQARPDGTLDLVDNQTGQRILRSPSLEIFSPVLDGERAELSFSRMEETGPGQVDLHFQGEGLESFFVRFEARPGEDAFDISCAFRTHRAAQLNRIEFFPRETVLDVYDVVNYRNRHHTPAAWPELLIQSDTGIKTDTYSTDWQFAPHPTLFLLRKHKFQFFFGAFDLPRAYGMYLDAAKRKVKSWYLDYGAKPDGQPLAAGEEFISPRFRLFCRYGKTVEDMMDLYGRMLIEAGQIPNPTHKVREAWWREPIYCTWTDQVYLSRTIVPVELKDQANMNTGLPASVTILTEQLVRDAVKVIQREKLPFRTILIDAGWAVATGEWDPHPERFPNMRGLVDELHAQGFKVLVWWNWAEIWKDIEVNPAELAAGGKLNRHGARTRDYSLPAAQEYLRKQFHFLFSSDPGCCDLDGVKTDFLADKVHPDIPPADPSWRGEENYFLHVTRLFYTELKRNKPDGMHMGCAGNFWLAEHIDINRTYDVHGTNFLEHEERGRMLRHTTPGCPVSYDFQLYLDNFERYLLSAHDCGASVQVGSVLQIPRDTFATPEPASPDFFALLRTLLPFQKR
jgi:hypothetical protein